MARALKTAGLKTAGLKTVSLLLTVSLASILAHPAFAADVEASSRIEQVTVYPDAASITRRVQVDLPAGASSIIYRGLPLGIDPGSLRVEGSSSTKLSIGSVETRVAPARTRPADSSIDARLKQVRSDRDGWQVTIDALEGKKAMIQRFAQSSPEKLGPDAKPLDIGQWSSAWDAVGQGLAKIGDELRAARARAKELDDEIASLEQSRNKPANGATAREVTVAVDADAATKADLTLTYRVPGAGWQPTYDARLDTRGEKPALEFVRRAAVTQRTGEDWSGVSLTVSTVRARRGTQAPDLQTERVIFWEPRPVPLPAPAPRVAAEALQGMKKAEGAADTNAAASPAEETQATLDAGAYQAAFQIPGKIDVPADGATKTFRISTANLSPDLIVRATPSIDETAYLEAKIVNGEDAPMLPGVVNLNRDGLFVGSGRLRLVAAGDSAQLGFGADDAVKVTRVPVQRKENEPTWLGSTKTETREFKTTLRNLHAFPVKVSITDQMPVSENSAIVVETLPATTPPTEKVVNDRRGVMGWTYELAPNETKEIRLAYRLKWPADRDLIFQTVPNGPTPVPMPR